MYVHRLVDELTSRDVEFQGVPPGYEPHIKAETPVDFSQSKVKELAMHHVDRSSKGGYQRRPFLSVSSSMESGPADCKQGCDCTVDSGPEEITFHLFRFDAQWPNRGKVSRQMVAKEGLPSTRKHRR